LMGGGGVEGAEYGIEYGIIDQVRVSAWTVS